MMRAAIASLVALALVPAASPAAQIKPPVAPTSVDAGADVLLEPAAGSTLTVRYRPAGCHDVACDVVATAGNGAQEGDGGSVTPVGGTSVQAVSETPALVATPGVLFAYWAYQNDSICSAVFGCDIWRMTLGSSAWCDTDQWCWGTRSRYGRVADINCGRASAGYSITNGDCSFHGDPSKTDLYASYLANVSGVVRGFPLNEDHYIHRHYTLARSWVAVG